MLSAGLASNNVQLFVRRTHVLTCPDFKSDNRPWLPNKPQFR